MAGAGIVVKLSDKDCRSKQPWGLNILIFSSLQSIRDKNNYGTSSAMGVLNGVHMNIRKHTYLLGCLTAALLTSPAWAIYTPVATSGSSDGPGKHLEEQLRLLSGNTLTVDIDSDSDQLDDGLDAYWNILGSTPSAVLVLEIAGNAGVNKLGIFKKGDVSSKQQLFDGSASPNGSSITFTPSWDDFGFYIEKQGSYTWYSDTSLNSGGKKDHLVAYKGQGDDLLIKGSTHIWDSSSYLLAWEDLNLGDADYNDMVVLVKNVTPVPDSGTTMALLGLGLVGIGVLRQKRA
ncbi:MAG: DUF4114 domain-containing protein [Verrucomicrobia bacterium]|nr:DUF4114 domain-containing protein [Verrucomicrobiota bacterium]